MKAITIHLFDTGDQLRCVTMTSGCHMDKGWDWGREEIHQLDGYSEATEAVRNHLLGVIADIDWRSRIEKLPTTLEYKIPDKYSDYES